MKKKNQVVSTRLKRKGPTGSFRKTGPIRTVIPKPIAFSDIQDTYLRYPQLITRSGVVGEVLKWRGNGGFDPYSTGTGTQPTGFDELALLYEKYCVFGSALHLTIENGSTLAAMNVVTIPSSDSISTALYNDVAALPRAVIQSVEKEGRVVRKTRNRCQTSTVLGLQGKQQLDDIYCSSVVSDPSSQWYWNVGLFSVDGASNIACTLTVDLVIHIRFFDRLHLSPSAFEERMMMIRNAKRAYAVKCQLEMEEIRQTKQLVKGGAILNLPSKY